MTVMCAILRLFETWGGIDRSDRRLAHRGSRLALVHVSESTVLRVLATEGFALEGKPRREPQVRAPWPEWVGAGHWTRRGAGFAVTVVVASGSTGVSVPARPGALFAVAAAQEREL